MNWFVAFSVSLGAVGLLLSSEAQPRPLQLLKVDLGDGVLLELVHIAAGQFRMGAPASDKDAYDDEQPQHDVTLTRPFYLGKYEVTVAQFRRFVAATNYQTDAEKDGLGGFGTENGVSAKDPKYNWRQTGFAQTDTHPVVNVSWNDATAFLQWLSTKTNHKCRLPTEAEWEYACRAGTTTPYFTGLTADTLRRSVNGADQTLQTHFPKRSGLLPFADGSAFTAPVGKGQPNAWGLYDMTGNVWEWCADRYGEDEYQRGACTDPPGPATGTARVGRGGSWNDAARSLRVTYRGGYLPTNRVDTLGFRVACESGN